MTRPWRPESSELRDLDDDTTNLLPHLSENQFDPAVGSGYPCVLRDFRSWLRTVVFDR